MKKRDLVLNRLIAIGFIGYGLILFVERLLAIIFSFNNGNSVSELYNTSSLFFFPIVTYAVTILSIALGFLFFAPPLFPLVKGLFSKKKELIKFDYKKLVIGSMILLVSGMMHTGFTLAPLQFVAYGFLIMAMLVRAIEGIYEGKDKYQAIVSFIYLVFFSMTIPVAYLTSIVGPIGTAIYGVEFSAIIVLIPCFGLMLYKFLKMGTYHPHACPLAVMVLFCGTYIALKWNDTMKDSNAIFLLMFVSLSFVTFFVYHIGNKIRQKANKQ